MRSLPRTRFVIGTVALLASAAAAPPRPELPPPPSAPAPPRAGTATGLAFPAEDAGERTLAALRGARVVDTAGRELGEVDDFLIHRDTGRITFAIISSGGELGTGHTVRRVPAEKLRWEDGHFVAEIADDVWRAARVKSAAGEDAAMRGLFRAGDVTGRSIRRGREDLGELEAVVFDFGRGIAMALVDTSVFSAADGERVLVPFDRLEFPRNGDGALTTNLRESDFNDLEASWNQTTGPHQPLEVANRHRERRGLPPLTDANPVDLAPSAEDTLEAPAPDRRSRQRER